MYGAGVNAMHQHSIQNTDGIAALVIPLATYNVDHTHLNYIYGGNPPHVDIIVEFQANKCSNSIFLIASSTRSPINYFDLEEPGS